MKVFLFALISCACILCTNAQKYVDNWYNDDSGLPQNSVKDIAKDKCGFIWFATESGLVRYNGQDFKVFTKIKELESHRMESFFTENDTLFVRTSKNEILYIDNLNPHYYSPYQDHKRKRLDSLSFNTFKLANFRAQDNPANDYHAFKSRNAFIASTKSDIYYFKGENKLIKSYKIENFSGFKASYVKDDDWFIILDNDILKYDFEKENFESIYSPTSLKIKKVFYNEAHDQVFVIDKQEVYKLHINKDEFWLVKLHDNLDYKQRFVTCFFYDEKYATLYSGSWAFGLGISKYNNFQTFQVEQDRTKNLVYSFNVGANDSIYTPNGVIILDNQIIQENAIDNHKLIKQFFPRDQNGEFYAVNKKDIVKLKFDTKELRFQEKDLFNFAEDLGALYITALNELYISTKSFTKDKTLLLKTNNLNEKKTDLDTVMKFENQILFIKESLDFEHLWLGTDNGVYQFHLTDKSLTPIEGTENSYIRSINEMQDYVWFASYDNGFSLYDKKSKKLTHYPYDKEQRLATVHHVIEDDNNQVWLPTNKGLFKADKTELFDYAEGKKGQINYYFFDKKDGLATNEFNGGCYPCVYKNRKGNIVIPSLNGLVSFNPNDFKRYDKKDEKVFIDEIILDGKAFPPTEKFMIPKDFNSLEIRVDALSFNRLPVINFTSPLSPNLSEYSSVKEGKLIFTTLPYGLHQLNFSLGSNQADAQTVLLLEVEKHWYETHVFHILVILLASGLVFLVIRLIIIRENNRSFQLKRIINEKTKQLQSTIQDLRTSQDYFKTQLESQKKIVASISHDIKSPLQYLAYGIQFLESNLKDKNLDKDIYENIDALNSSVEKLQGFTQNILDFSKALIQNDAKEVENINVKALAEEKAGLFDQMCKLKKIELKIESKPEVLFPLNKNLFSVILHNILDNAIKNTYNGSVKIKIQKIGNQLLVKISDTGAGMNKETLERYRSVFQKESYKVNVSGSGLGLYIVSETAKLMNAEIEIDSEKDVGTQFFMKLKKAN